MIEKRVLERRNPRVGSLFHGVPHNLPFWNDAALRNARTDAVPSQLHCCMISERGWRMAKRRARSKSTSGARRTSVVGIPEDLAAIIKRCWPRGIVEEFPADESYFQEIRHQIERDLSRISGASLVWQTEEA